MFKKYISPNRANYYTSVNIDGVNVPVAFRSQKIGGIFVGTVSTNDPIIQKGIEADPRYGKDFINLNPEEAVTPVAVELPSDGMIRVPAEEVAGFQRAKKYLITKGFCTSDDLSDGESVLKVTKENNIIFLGYNQKEAPKLK